MTSAWTWGCQIARVRSCAEPHAVRKPIDIHPPQREQLTLAHSRHGRREVERPIDAAERVVELARVELARVELEAVEVDRRRLGDRELGPDRFPGQLP